MDLRPPPMSLQPSRANLRPFKPTPFGRYTLLLPLSTGGMGEIFLARLEGAQGFEKLCVIKRILPHLAEDPEFVARFVNEAKTLVKLSHGAIAQVLDMGVVGNQPYLALEHIDGKDLRRVAARMRDKNLPMPLTFVLYVMSRVLDALAYAHRKRDEDEKEIGLVHRDVSPQNVLISYEGEVKVIDFGLAKSTLNAGKTNPSIVLGKFLYMSPEQARHQPVDRRSDLYAAGLCLYELLAGKNPFDDVPPGELMAQVASPSIPHLSEVEPLTPPAVSQLVMRALAVDPAQRFQTAEEFRGRLQAVLLDIDASAGPETTSKVMRDAFSAEFQAERKLLQSLREQVRPSEPPPSDVPVKVVLGPPSERAYQLRPVPELPGPRPGAEPEPLSFQPTPLAREVRPGLEDKDRETMPSVLLAPALRDEEPATGPAPVVSPPDESPVQLRPSGPVLRGTLVEETEPHGKGLAARPPKAPAPAAAPRVVLYDDATTSATDPSLAPLDALLAAKPPLPPPPAMRKRDDSARATLPMPAIAPPAAPVQAAMPIPATATNAAHPAVPTAPAASRSEPARAAPEPARQTPSGQGPAKPSAAAGKPPVGITPAVVRDGSVRAEAPTDPRTPRLPLAWLALPLVALAVVLGWIAWDSRELFLAPPPVDGAPPGPTPIAPLPVPEKQRDRGPVAPPAPAPDPAGPPAKDLDEDLGALQPEKAAAPAPKSPRAAKGAAKSGPQGAFADVQRSYAALEAVDGNQARKFTIRVNVLSDTLEQGLTPEAEASFVKQCRALARELAEARKGVH